MIEKNRFFVYYPENETVLALRLLDDIEPMAAYLESRGLPVKRPLHIILDDDLDEPQAQVSMYPHREVRLPLKAPGVLEDGFLESNPWRHFLFMGLCIQGIYSERSSLPQGAHYLFGEIVSPNQILPEWTIDGISHLLYEQFIQRCVDAPLFDDIFRAGPIPKLEKVSNHSEVWPGRASFRIYGRPFVCWLYQRFGWEKLHAFLRLHGGGIIPIEIDSKAEKAFGQTWHQLWKKFKSEHDKQNHDSKGAAIEGYWPDPYVYWNENGVYPGLVKNGIRGRYGYADQRGWLWLSQYQGGTSYLNSQHRDVVRTAPRKHVWDPGPGSVAVTRKGHRPYLLINTPAADNGILGKVMTPDLPERLIAAPQDVIQLSGPVMDEHGRIVVAGNSGGNWDIWLYENGWHRLTTADSIEFDPWLENNKLLFTSNAGGRFQIHTIGMRQLTNSPTAAMLPRKNSYLQLTANGWVKQTLSIDDLPDMPPIQTAMTVSPADKDHAADISRPYSALKSIMPNYILPDLYFDGDNLQLGVSTEVQDVSKQYAWDAGIRYDMDDSAISWRLGGRADGFSARANHYRFGYETQRQIQVDETRYEIKTAWSRDRFKDLEISANWRHYVSEDDGEEAEQEWWGSVSYSRNYYNLNTQIIMDWFTDNSQSVYGEVLYWFGQETSTIMRLQAGKTWGDLSPGHNSFRIGGGSGEGFFTDRPTRLFPLRGFDSNILDAEQAATTTIETFWPLARLQTGYRTLPLFLHNISVGTFMDAGFASKNPDYDDLLVSAGFELITGMELAWGYMASFRIGWAWPLKCPDDIDQSGPVFLIQIGRPL